MKDVIKEYLEDNKDLIVLNTRESWETLYDRIRPLVDRGEFTETLLNAGIDPAEKMAYLPLGYLYGSSINSYTIPSNCLYIESNSFSDCDNLTNILIPDKVTHLLAWAFYNCKKLKEITLPNRLVAIASYTIYRCPFLQDIYYKGTKTLWRKILKGGKWLYKVPSTCIIHCTDGDISIEKED